MRFSSTVLRRHHPRSRRPNHRRPPGWSAPYNNPKSCAGPPCPTRVKPAIGQIRANTHHNADDPRRKVIEAFFQPNPVRGRKTAAVAVDVIGIPLHPAPHISVVENPAAKYQRALPDRNGRPRRRRSTGIRTCRRQRQQNGQPPQPTKTKVHRIFHTIGISERLRI